MTRILLTYVLPLVLPAALYFVWLWSARARAQPGGAQARPAAWWEEAPWPWLALAGVALMAATLFALALTSGSPPGKVYNPPHVENGRIVPGRFQD